MPFDSVAGLVEELRKTKLLKPAQIDETVRMLQPRFPSALGLAKELVRRGWLTVYQVNQLFQANGQPLILGPYQILDHLGKGGVSQVFKAWHTERDCLAALKVIHPHLLTNAEAVGRFQREMKAVTRLSHPNIVCAFEDSAIGEAHFFAMEFVQGTDLKKLLELSGPLPIAQACDFIRQAALGLEHAHKQGLVHRDIKPANLVQIEGGNVLKILDFGLARLHTTEGADPATALTAQGAMIGTADYVAPEQARNARQADIRSDVYSLGCTFYHLLTGGPPFPGGSAMQKIHHHINREPTSVRLLRSETPAEVEAIVRRMLAKQPADRFQTPAEVAERLQPYSS
ncbi:MAG: serine/threonine protein kinase [Planctomycetia bacterium]|nr:serine/threonine protein kinase [Planctomycetia bacterium]